MSSPLIAFTLSDKWMKFPFELSLTGVSPPSLPKPKLNAHLSNSTSLLASVFLVTGSSRRQAFWLVAYPMRTSFYARYSTLHSLSWRERNATQPKTRKQCKFGCFWSRASYGVMRPVSEKWRRRLTRWTALFTAHGKNWAGKFSGDNKLKATSVIVRFSRSANPLDWESAGTVLRWWTPWLMNHI